MQSSIDVALWILVEDDKEQFDHNRTPYAYMLTYVDDFLIMGPRDVRNTIEEEISRTWTIKVTGEVNQFDIQNPEASLTFLVNDFSLASRTRRFHDESRCICARRT